MLRTYLTYALTLWSAFWVYWTFSVMATVAASYSWMPYTSFLASVLHFGLSSWLFLYLPKVGKLLAIATALLMCAWPVYTFISFAWNWELVEVLVYLLPVLLSSIVVYNHTTSFKRDHQPKGLARIVLSIIPAALLALFIGYYLFSR